MIGQALIMLALLGLAHALTRGTSLDASAGAEGRRDGWWAIGTILGGMAIFLGLLLASDGSGGDGDAPVTYGPGSVVNQLVLVLVLGAPAIARMLWTRVSLRELGLTLGAPRETLLLGFISLGAIAAWTVFAEGVAVDALDGGQVWALMSFSVLAFGEELLYRGFLQGRLSRWLGWRAAWLITVGLFVLAHLPMIFAGSMSVSEQVLFVLVSLLLPALLWGYMAARLGSIWLPIVLHALGHWAGTLAASGGG